MYLNKSLKIALLSLVAASTVSAATFKLQRPAYSVWENAGPLPVTVLRSGSGTNSAASVEIFTTNGTAQAGLDYNSTVTTINFNPGQLSATVNIGIIDDTVIEPTRTFQVKLRNPSTGNTIAVPTVATVSILDDDSDIQFSSKSFTTMEALKFATITIKRFGNLNTTGRVDFATSDGSATAGTDYFPTNGTIIFPPRIAVKTIQVRLINDTIAEGSETVNLTLSKVVGATLGTNNTATLTILDNDTAGAIKLAAAVSVDSIKTNVVITISRTGGAASGVTVHYATVNGTAVAGANYVATSGTLTFPDGVVSATLNVPIIPASGTGANKTFTFALSNPTGGATLGAVSQSVVTIVFKPDPNAVPITGPVFMSATVAGQAFNAPANLVVGSTLAGNSGFQVVGYVHGIGANYTPIIKSILFDVFPFTTGTHQLDNSGTRGLMIYSQTIGSSGRVWTVADGSASVGSSGTVVVDGIDTVNKMISGHFDFNARESSNAVAPNGTFIRVTGKFRCHYL